MKSFENEIEKATELSKQYRELTRHNSLATYNISKSIDALVRNIDLDLEIYFFSFMDKRILGHSMTDKFGTTITLNTLLEYKNNDPRTGFTLAHELGHVVLGHPLGISFPDLNSVKGYERSANVFAANLLMPFEVIVSQIQEGFTLKRISATSGVSIQSAIIRLKEIMLLRIGIESNTIDKCLEMYRKATTNKNVKHTLLYELLSAYMEYTIDNKRNLRDYISIKNDFHHIAEHVVHSYNKKYPRKRFLDLRDYREILTAYDPNSKIQVSDSDW